MLMKKTRLGGNAPGLPAGLLPAPLPSLSSAFSRRAALFGAVTATGFLAAAAVPAIARSGGNEDRLVGLADELHAVDAEQIRLCRLHRDADCDDIPGYPSLEERRTAALDSISSTEATTVAGLVAKAGAMVTDGVQADWDRTDVIGTSLARDLLRLHAAGVLA